MFLSGVRHCRKLSDGHRHSQKERMSRGQKRKKSNFSKLKAKVEISTISRKYKTNWQFPSYAIRTELPNQILGIKYLPLVTHKYCILG